MIHMIQKKHILIFARAAAMVLCSTSNIYFISHKMYLYAIIDGAAISTMWTLNIKDLAISNWRDRLSYVLGGVLGTTLSLYVLIGFFEK
jgi:hypothetical protein